ncbi:hypothetical protein ISS07_03195 [Candidatus Woesearchaeota archaeon]|nr:hypothetical protein [Candidatus Woesearchaeota archaeon]
MRCVKFLLALTIFLLIGGCVQEVQQESSKTFSSDEHGFSFIFPVGWEEITEDLPNNWAIVKGDNAMISSRITGQSLKEIMR